jgi:peroxiredoxin Q/BCP
MVMTSWATRARALGVFALAVGLLGADEAKQADLKKGDKAPAFQATDDQGKDWKSSDHVGKKILVLFFYSADLTGG